MILNCMLDLVIDSISSENFNPELSSEWEYYKHKFQLLSGSSRMRRLKSIGYLYNLDFTVSACFIYLIVIFEESEL